MSNNTEYRIQAEFIVVEPELILSNAQLLIRNERIIELCETPSLQPDLHLPHSTLLPGFINSHTHLEFSDLIEPFPAGPNFPTWIAAVVGHRRKQLNSLAADQLLANRQQAIEIGLSECQRLGTAAIVDIVTPPWSMVQPMHGDRNSTIRPNGPGLQSQIIALAEVLGLDLLRFDQSLEWADSLLRQAAQPSLTPLGLRQQVIGLGISPHAPYSLIHPEALDCLRDFHEKAMIAMHVAESLEERQWQEHGNGAFLELYERIGLPVEAPRMPISDAIQLLASRPRSLLIHGNYLNTTELEQIADTSISIVYCPRTHQHFGHSRYPLQSMIERSIPVVLGTDSRASNPDLSIWRECCQARQLHSDTWNAADALAAITTSPAEILGLAQELGSLHPGRQAFINCVSTPSGATTQSLLSQLFKLDAAHPEPLMLK